MLPGMGTDTSALAVLSQPPLPRWQQADTWGWTIAEYEDVMLYYIA